MEDRAGRFRADDAVAWVAGLGTVATAAALGIVSGRSGGSLVTIALQTLLVACGLAGGAALWRRTGRSTLIAIGVVAFAARAALVPWPPLQSNDLYRYLWDGRLLLHGIDPYVAVPSSPRIAALFGHDWLYPYIDWRDVPTLYPPLDLTLYALGAFFAGGTPHAIVPLKLVLLGGDVATCVLLAYALHARGLPLGRLALYAWNPLVVVEFALNGHEESLAIACLVGTVAAFGARRPLAAGVAIAGAVLTKLYPAAFVPALFARRAFAPAALVAIALVVLAYVPFVLWNRDVLGFLHTFAFGYHFNDSLHLVLGTFGGAAILVTAIVVAARARARGASAIAVLIGLELTYLLVSPNVYPWYVAVFAALLPLVPDAFSGTMRPLSLALVAWTALAPLAYLVPWVTASDSPLDISTHVLEYVPLVLAALAYARPYARRLAAMLGIAALSGCGSALAANADRIHAAEIARGARFYAANCAVCHRPTATSFIGPDLTHVAARRSRASLRTHIAIAVPNGTTFSPATVAALVAYLTALNSTTPERSRTK